CPYVPLNSVTQYSRVAPPRVQRRVGVSKPNLTIQSLFGSGLGRRTICGLSIWVLSIVAVHRSWTVSQRKTLCSAVLDRHRWIVRSWRAVRLQNGLPLVTGFLNRLRPTVPADDYDWRIYETVSSDHRRSLL